jgi:26S proteasome non-ATPase regulatory subunit 10
MNDELLRAVEEGDLQRADALLREGTSPHEDSWGLSLLDDALSRRDERMARLLIEHGARIDERDSRGQTRLHRAARQADDSEAVTLLIRLGLDVNATDRDGWTPLHHAAAHGYGNVIAVLLTAGADRDVQTAHEKRAADLAAANGYRRLPL